MTFEESINDLDMSSLLETCKNLPAHMDFDGQRRAERIFQAVILLFAFIGLIWGYMCQQFSQTVYILGCGFTLSCLLTLPPWPMYRTKPLPWRKPIDDSQEAQKQRAQKKK